MMKAIEFEGVNVWLGKDQPEYQTLPVMMGDGPERRVTCCFELDEEEILAMQRNRHLWVQVLTFGQPFQPICLMVEGAEDVGIEGAEDVGIEGAEGGEL